MTLTLVPEPEPERSGEPAVPHRWRRGATRCPCCRISSGFSFGAGYLCGQCGNEWPADAVEAGADDVSSASVSLDRLRAFLDGPLTDTERVEARHRADRMTGWRRCT